MNGLESPLTKWLFLKLVLLIILLNIVGISVACEPVNRSSDPYVHETSDLLKIGNELLEIVITKSSYAIHSIIEKSTGTDFIKHKDVIGPLFWLVYYHVDIGEIDALVPSGALMFSRIGTAEKTHAWLNMTWSWLYSPRRRTPINVKVSISIFLPSKSKLSYWYISIDNNGGGVIEKIGFPLIFGLGQISDEETGDYLVMPQGPGILAKNPQLNFKPGVGLGGVYYPSEHFNMQFMAYYAKKVNRGLYLANYDTSGTFVKYFGVTNRQGKYLEIINEHIPEFYLNANVSIPYPIVIGVFEGDWWDAAQLYKSWATKQWWAAQGTLAERNDIPPWLMRTGIIADVLTRYWCRYSREWNGPFSNVPKIAEMMKKYYGLTPLLMWRGWEKHGFGMAPPEFFPPTEGWESFRRAINETHLNGGRIAVLPYTSIYSFNATGWQDYVAHAPRDRKGNLYVYRWSIHNNSGLITPQAGFIVSPGQRWSDKVLEIVRKLAESGIDMVQLDGNPRLPYIDWFGSEGRYGGGTWWAEGLISMFSRIRKEIRKINPEFALAAEWYAEPYVPYIDAANEVSAIAYNPSVLRAEDCYNASLNTFIPLWHAVYHEYLILYSTIAIIDNRNQTERLYYLRGLAIALTWGEIPMVTMDPPGTGPPYVPTLYDPTMLEYTRRIAQARAHFAYPYLVEGRMLRPPELKGVPLVKIPGAKQVPYSGADIPPFTWPGVMGSAWEAPDGSIGIVLTSICDKPVNVSILVSPLNLGERRPVYMVKNGKYIKLESMHSQPSSLNITLDPLDVCLIVLKQPETRCTLTLDSQPKVASMVIDGTEYSSNMLPLCFSWAAGTLHSIKAQAAVEIGNGTKYLFKSWSDGITLPERELLSYTSINLTAIYELEYEVSVVSSLGQITGGGWYPANSTVLISINPTIVELGNGTKKIFSGWVENGFFVSSEPVLTFTVDKPRKLTALWVSQFHIRVVSEYGNVTGSGWYHAGEKASISIYPTRIERDFFTDYVFDGWSSGGNIISIEPTFTITVDKPYVIVATWKTKIKWTTAVVIGAVVSVIFISIFIRIKRRVRWK